MPLYCCDCDCKEIKKPSRHVRVVTECRSSSSSVESIDEDLKRLDLLCNLEEKCPCCDELNLIKLKNATHEIKKMIDKVDDSLVKIKNNKIRRSSEKLKDCEICESEENKRKIIEYLNKNCTTHSNIYYCCCKTCCPHKKSESEVTVELIRHKHSQHECPCDLCWNDYIIKARRERSRSRRRSIRRRSRSACYSDDDDYISSDSCKPHEPWRSPTPVTNQYPWKMDKINKMRNS